MSNPAIDVYIWMTSRTNRPLGLYEHVPLNTFDEVERYADFLNKTIKKHHIDPVKAAIINSRPEDDTNLHDIVFYKFDWALQAAVHLLKGSANFKMTYFKQSLYGLLFGYDSGEIEKFLARINCDPVYKPDLVIDQVSLFL